MESEIKSFGGRVESTIKALEAENKALKEENANLHEMIEGKDQSKLSILNCAICMEFKKLDTFVINSPCGHCFCETVKILNFHENTIFHEIELISSAREKSEVISVQHAEKESLKKQKYSLRSQFAN